MNNTIAKKAIKSGNILISSEHARFLFHDFEADKISFNDNKIISATTPRTPSWGALIVDVVEIIPAELLTIVLDNITTPSG
ncbi:MAG: hypothetical protein O8C63_07875 [Candidatus Methanoperedens sp.]|nr:hypothetical protein [Candidatus Methanoperedens sp.]